MIKRTALIVLILLSSLLISACNEVPNPLLGQWQEISATGNSGKIITFSPSTMNIDNQAVTVVYQIRKKQVRVSASKNAIIYTFENDDRISYQDENKRIITLARVK